MVKALGPDLQPSSAVVDDPQALDVLVTELVGLAQAADDMYQRNVTDAIAKTIRKDKKAVKKSAKVAQQYEHS
jgi:hypothetical protein